MEDSNAPKYTMKQLAEFERWANAEGLNLELSRHGYLNKETAEWLIKWLQLGPEEVRRERKAAKRKGARQHARH